MSKVYLTRTIVSGGQDSKKETITQLKPEYAKEENRRLVKNDSVDKSGDIDDNSRYIAIHHSGDFMFRCKLQYV